MTEKEKILAGVPYDSTDKSLGKERTRTKKLCEELNASFRTARSSAAEASSRGISLRTA